MHIFKTRLTRLRRAFTLVELLTAMTITTILVVLIMQLTKQSVDLWKSIQEDTGSANTARMALQTICRDLEAFQVRSGNNAYEWLYAEVDGPMRGMPKGLTIPRSARLIFFTCAPDRNPAISANSSSRNSYRDIISSNTDTQGDVSAVSYRLLFRDQVLNLPSKNGDITMFPLFSLYRHVLTPRETFDYMLGRNDLKTAYTRFEPNEERTFLCENIVDLSYIFHVEYANEGASSSNEQVIYQSETVPILASSARRGQQRFRLDSNRAVSTSSDLKNARIVSVEVSLTVLTEEGVSLVQQVRLGQRHAPKLDDFYARYTRSYSRTVALPVPL